MSHRFSSLLFLAAAVIPVFAVPTPEPEPNFSTHHSTHKGPSSSHHKGAHHAAPPDDGSSDPPAPPTSPSSPFAGRCDLSQLSINGAPADIPPPTEPLTYVTIALGTQNYTCSSDGTYAAAGAVAELFDISCLSSPDGSDTLVDQLMTFWEQSPALFSTQGVIDFLLPATSEIILGQHYFILNPVTGEGISPKWDFSAQGAHKGNANAIVTVERLAGAPAPTGEDDIDWLATNSIEGELAAQVYRTDTRGGKPPPSCEIPGDTLEVKYTCKYWFFGGSIGGAAGGARGRHNTLHPSNRVTSGHHSDSSHRSGHGAHSSDNRKKSNGEHYNWSY